MGWSGSAETEQQVKVAFDSREEAIAFAEKRGITYEVEDRPPEKPRRGLSYSDNFKSRRSVDPLRVRLCVRRCPKRREAP